MSDEYSMDDIDDMLAAIQIQEFTGWQKRLLLQVMNHPEGLRLGSFPEGA